MALVNVDSEFIGKYKVRSVLGTGNTGEVKLGVHSETGEKVAIKIIPKSPATSKQAINLRREICYLKLIDHPNIVRLVDVAEGSNCTLIVMEYISGTELFYRIKEKIFKEKEMRHVFRQIVDALGECNVGTVPISSSRLLCCALLIMSKLCSFTQTTVIATTSSIGI
eukprot:Opistho-2@43857